LNFKSFFSNKEPDGFMAIFSRFWNAFSHKNWALNILCKIAPLYFISLFSLGVIAFILVVWAVVNTIMLYFLFIIGMLILLKNKPKLMETHWVLIIFHPILFTFITWDVEFLFSPEFRIQLQKFYSICIILWYSYHFKNKTTTVNYPLIIFSYLLAFFPSNLLLENVSLILFKTFISLLIFWVIDTYVWTYLKNAYKLWYLQFVTIVICAANKPLLVGLLILWASLFVLHANEHNSLVLPHWGTKKFLLIGLFNLAVLLGVWIVPAIIILGPLLSSLKRKNWIYNSGGLWAALRKIKKIDPKTVIKTSACNNIKLIYILYLFYY